jgi:hypothetical protein
MQCRATWRALAVTYGAVASTQLYLAIAMGVFWAWALAVVCAAVAVAFGAVAVCCSGADVEDAELPDPCERVVTSRLSGATSSRDHLR